MQKTSKYLERIPACYMLPSGMLENSDSTQGKPIFLVLAKVIILISVKSDIKVPKIIYNSKHPEHFHQDT